MHEDPPLPKLVRYTTPPNQFIVDQVIALAAECTPQLSMSGITPSNALYPIYELTLAAEVGIYLECMDPDAEARSELIVAMSHHSPSEVAGFVHYLPLKDSKDACGITYIAVAKHVRHNGVASTLIEELRKAYPNVGLSCSIEKVDVFKKLGFNVVGSNQNHVEMNTELAPTPGVMGVLDVAPLFESPEVMELQATLEMKHKRSGLKQAHQQLARSYRRDCERVSRFVREHLAD